MKLAYFAAVLLALTVVSITAQSTDAECNQELSNAFQSAKDSCRGQGKKSGKGRGGAEFMAAPLKKQASSEDVNSDKSARKEKKVDCEVKNLESLTASNNIGQYLDIKERCEGEGNKCIVKEVKKATKGCKKSGKKDAGGKKGNNGKSKKNKSGNGGIGINGLGDLSGMTGGKGGGRSGKMKGEGGMGKVDVDTGVRKPRKDGRQGGKDNLGIDIDM